MCGSRARSVAAAGPGEERYAVIAEAIETAAALAESEAVRHVRKAGEHPQFWAASMTYLERRYPDRWGRRTEDADVPRIIVQIGVRDGDVKIHPLGEELQKAIGSGAKGDSQRVLPDPLTIEC
jgi:hypothetical protein